jgi:hypothetical protein
MVCSSTESLVFFNRHCNPCGLWPAQLSLSILSRKVFTEYSCQRHVKSEPQQRKVELWAKNCREFCRKWRLPRHFWALLHAVNLRHVTDSFTSPPKEVEDFFDRKIRRPGLNPRTWVLKPARSPLDHQSRYSNKLGD